MWYSASASAVALLQQPHLLVGGLGGIIAVIVGGVVSVITMRNSRRSVARQAPPPQPAPASRRPATPPSYAEPAPPTSPARRLHPGPISLSAPRQPSPQGDDENARPSGVALSLFNPDILTGAPAELAEPTATAPLLRGASDLLAEWRAQSAPASNLTHAPIWNRSPFAAPESPESPASFTTTRETPAISFTSAPPIWRSILANAPAERARPEDETLASLSTYATPAPIWESWLSAPAQPATLSQSEALAEAPATEHAAPIWPSSLREE